MDKRRGFTLIELLVVIAIVALLMSILMPALRKAREQAKAVACMSHLHQWGIVFNMYCDDNDGYFSGGRTTPIGFREHEWVYNLKPYFKTCDVAMCPAAPTTWCHEPAGPHVGWDWRCIEKYLEDEMYDYYANTYGGYGKNSWCGAWPYHGNCPNQDSPHACNWRTIYGIKNGNRVPLFLDSIFMGGFPADTAAPGDWPGQTFWSGSPGGGGEIDRYVIPRHGDHTNSLFVDLSVRPVELKCLWKLKWHRLFDTEGPYTLEGGLVPEDNWPEWMRKYPECR